VAYVLEVVNYDHRIFKTNGHSKGRLPLMQKAETNTSLFCPIISVRIKFKTLTHGVNTITFSLSMSFGLN
jgi:hypothetical protein